MVIHTAYAAIVEAAIDHLGKVDPVLSRAIALVGPCTLVPNPSLFESLVDAIISQQISVKAADAILARVRAALPDGLIVPEAFASLDIEALRGLGLSPQKAGYIRNLVDHIVEGKLELTYLAELDDEAVISQLTAVKGIGRWTAEMILIFSLARPDVLPVDDLGLVEAVRTAYEHPTRPTRRELLERGELWRPYRTFATWYMWGLRRHSMSNNRPRTRIVSL
jgi:DNA-3-methyladenine glycosylase II